MNREQKDRIRRRQLNEEENPRVTKPNEASQDINPITGRKLTESGREYDPRVDNWVDPSYLREGIPTTNIPPITNLPDKSLYDVSPNYSITNFLDKNPFEVYSNYLRNFYEVGKTPDIEDSDFLRYQLSLARMDAIDGINSDSPEGKSKLAEYSSAKSLIDRLIERRNSAGLPLDSLNNAPSLDSELKRLEMEDANLALEKSIYGDTFKGGYKSPYFLPGDRDSKKKRLYDF